MYNEIQVLSEIEAVRKNPSMYIGSVCEMGAHHLLFELIHNSIDESIMGSATSITVTIDHNSCTVEDNGRGLPLSMNLDYNLTNAELVLTKLHSGSKFKKINRQFTTGLHGVGLSCVNALSSNLNAIISNNESIYSISFQKGQKTSALEKVSSTDKSGTKIRFTPDLEIFKEFLKFDTNKIKNFINEISYFNPQVTFILIEELDKTKEMINSLEGVVGLLRYKLNGIANLLPNAINLKFEADHIKLEAAFNWTNLNEVKDFSYVNGVNTYLGGTHVQAFKVGVKNALVDLININFRNKWEGEALLVDEAFDGVYSIVSCYLSEPNFEGQTKNRLTNKEIINEVEKNVHEQIVNYFRNNSKAFSIVFERMLSIRNAKASAKRVAERVYLQFGSKKINEEIYKEQFGARSKNWHSSAVWIAHDELLKEHANHFKLGEDSIALDVCCGSGVVGASFKSKVKKVIGLDLTPEMVALSKTRLDEVHQGNVYNIPFADNSFDLVCTREVLHLLPYPEKPVSEIFRVLKPGGQFIVGQILPFSEVDGPWMYRIFKKKQPLIYNMFQEEDFRKMLLNGGFTDLEMTEMNVWENIDVWINSYETTDLHRHEIREIYKNASEEVRQVHPFKILPNGEIHDLWRWCIFSVRKPK